MVAAGFHRHCQFTRAAERADEQRHQQGNHRLRAGEKVARLKIRTARHLRLHNLVRFLHQRGDEAERNGHHHRQLVRGKVKALERR